MNGYWVVFLVTQGFALLGLFLWWPSWSGKSTQWLEGRGWGWRPLVWLFSAVFFQAAAIGALVMRSPVQRPIIDAEKVLLVSGVLWVIACPVIFIGAYFWWPRFMLPGWIRERLRAGDPAKTAFPLPEVQHLMTKPQNQLPPWLTEPGVRVVPGPHGRLTYADHRDRFGH